MANTLISARDASESMNRWIDYVNANTNLRSVFDLSGTLIKGAKMNYTEFKTLVSPVGIETFKIRFGLTTTDTLEFIVYGVDADNIMVPSVNDAVIYSLDNFVTTSYLSGRSFTYPTDVENAVPPLLAESWLTAWNSVGTTLDSSAFSLYGAVLQGYTCAPEEFYQVIAHQESSTGLDINIAMTLHEYSTGSTASVMMVPITEDTKTYALNFSAPCPGTCILRKKKA